ncbi:sugar ABC transporter ATP-binding protein [Nesterenkonia sp. NBAIMH1]|uniref:sugar ABC transporter ATP-binding protein n=1 Tax=Nesterenkonia sp. NBAIMH1 TaxID=2600320 RepID=UPI0011B727A5|nr:sugar ABC transporter ATP-binding protein [Nesterenkonia sp. NBAIMH1]
MSTGLLVENLRKKFGPVEVLKGVNLEFRRGEVHAFLGANGAGKSTLLSCLSGAHRSTSGRITIGGKAYEGFSPTGAFEAGIAIIYQHFQLAGSLSIADNIFLGDELGVAGVLNRRVQDQVARELLQSLGTELDPRTPVEKLSIGQQQIVEIARALRREPSVLILDEPTAALGQAEVDSLLALVRKLAHERDIAVVFVTHILGEVMEAADRVSILRDGRVLWSKQRQDVTLEALVSGISPSATGGSGRTDYVPGPENVRFSDYRTSYCGPVDLSIGEGEVVGVYAMMGGGRTNLLETLAGARRPRGGRLTLGGRNAKAYTPRQAARSGISLVASDRPAQSLFAELSALDNLLMPHFRYLSRGLRLPRQEKGVFNRVAEKVQLSPPAADANASAFSGGNAQKIVVGRWLAGLGETRLLLLDEPTQGVDIGSREQIYRLVKEFAAQAPGRSVLFTTSDPEEAVALADRIVVLHEGQITDVFGPEVDEETLLSKAQSVDLQSEKVNAS